MNPNIGLEEGKRIKSIEILKKLLSDEFVLYTKTKFYHWNVTGKIFQQLHDLFEAQAGEMLPIIDDTAERIRALGHLSIGSLKEFLNETQIKEDTELLINDERMIRNLLADHETIIQSIRKNIETIDNESSDHGTSDFLTGIMITHEKMAWILRSHLT